MNSGRLNNSSDRQFAGGLAMPSGAMLRKETAGMSLPSEASAPTEAACAKHRGTKAEAVY